MGGKSVPAELTANAPVVKCVSLGTQAAAKYLHRWLNLRLRHRSRLHRRLLQPPAVARVSLARLPRTAGQSGATVVQALATATISQRGAGVVAKRHLQRHRR